MAMHAGDCARVAGGRAQAYTEVPVTMTKHAKMRSTELSGVMSPYAMVDMVESDQ